MTTKPKHVELFITNAGKIVAQARNEENGRLGDPFSIAVAGPEWAAFLADWGPAQQAQIESLTTAQETLQAEIDRLTALIPPPLPERSIYPRELLGRLTMAEVVAAIRSDDDAVIFAVANLQTTVSPVLLDSEETRMLIGSLVMAGILTPERMAEVLA